MRNSRFSQELTKPINRVTQIRASDGEVLELPNESAITGWVWKQISNIFGELEIRSHGNGRRFACQVTSLREKLKGIFPLADRDPFFRAGNLDAQEETKRAKILDLEMSMKRGLEDIDSRIVITRNDNVVHID